MLRQNTGRAATALYLGAWVIAVAVWATAPVRADDAPFRWTGFYVGAHTGAARDDSDFANPYGRTLFGNEVRSPGPFIGGQLGYNYQYRQAVFGLQADASWANLQGTATCMQPVRRLPAAPPVQFVGGAFGATCEVEPDAFGTISARGGLVLGPSDRILVYGKGGLAWIHNNVEIGQNNSETPNFGPDNALAKTGYTQWGWTLGAGLEYALSSRWSLGVEYDYLQFGDRRVATPRPGPFASPATPGIAAASATDGRLAGLSQDVHSARLAINYSLGDRGEPLPGPELAGSKAVAPAFATGFESEIGGRYVYAWTRFQQDLGRDDRALPVNNSRLTWEGVGTNGVELYGRVDTPWNVMMKGIVGIGRGDQGHINDQDWGLPRGQPVTSVEPYSNTLSNVSSSLDYFTLDGGYDWLRTDTYRVASFVGYNYFRYKMNALGCRQLNVAPPDDCGDPPTTVILQEMDEWRSLRLGTAADLMLTPQLKLSAEAAYLPYVSYSGIDNHPQRAAGGGSTRSPANGVGTGVQLEGVVSYDIAPQFSVGVGGRYWSMSVPQGLTNFFSKNEFIRERFTTEQSAVFVQGSYKFDAPAD
jgi:opacity protein-like surface antigen